MRVGAPAVVPVLLSGSGPSAFALATPTVRATGAAGPHAASGTSFAAALHTAVGEAAGRRLGQRQGADELDAAARQAAHLAAPGLSPDALMQPRAPTLTFDPSTPSAGASAAPPASLEEILPALVRKIAWSGDARRGAVRIELGSGALAGATLVVAADRGRVQVTLRAHDGAGLDSWRERIAARLAARGLDVEVT